MYVSSGKNVSKSSKEVCLTFLELEHGLHYKNHTKKKHYNFSSLFYSDAAFTIGNAVHQNPASFHDKVTNMEALVRSLKTYYEVQIEIIIKLTLLNVVYLVCLLRRS